MIVICRNLTKGIRYKLREKYYIMENWQIKTHTTIIKQIAYWLTGGAWNPGKKSRQ